MLEQNSSIATRKVRLVLEKNKGQALHWDRPMTDKEVKIIKIFEVWDTAVEETGC